MIEKKENKNSPTGAVHPAVLQVSGDQTRRWTVAIWSVNPGASAILREIQELVEGTLIAHLSYPPSEKERVTESFDSFDLVFFEEVPQKMIAALTEGGWEPVEVSSLTDDELDRLTVFQSEARKADQVIADGPVAMWRMPVARGAEELRERVDNAAERTLPKIKGQVWGEQPGWFSRAFCEELRQEVQVTITPDAKGLAALEDIVVDRLQGHLQVHRSIVFQAICDFIGVLLQAQGHVEVQWGTCPVDERSGLAPAPVMRMRHPGGVWKVLAVGRDVVRRISVPWGAPPEKNRLLVALLEEYNG